VIERPTPGRVLRMGPAWYRSVAGARAGERPAAVTVCCCMLQTIAAQKTIKKTRVAAIHTSLVLPACPHPPIYHVRDAWADDVCFRHSELYVQPPFPCKPSPPPPNYLSPSRSSSACFLGAPVPRTCSPRLTSAAPSPRSHSRRKPRAGGAAGRKGDGED
jgi:hypothetical protein